MGQVESATASFIERQSGQPSPSSTIPAKTSTSDNNSLPPALDSLVAEAAAYGEEDENETLEAKARKALECPCISHLRMGPCGAQFSDAFLCFLKSSAEEKGSDCVHTFVDLQSCIKANPNAFSKDVREGDDFNVEKPAAKAYRIIPPIWSVESNTRKPKL